MSQIIGPQNMSKSVFLLARLSRTWIMLCLLVGIIAPPKPWESRNHGINQPILRLERQDTNRRDPIPKKILYVTYTFVTLCDSVSFFEDATENENFRNYRGLGQLQISLVSFHTSHGKLCAENCSFLNADVEPPTGHGFRGTERSR